MEPKTRRFPWMFVFFTYGFSWLLWIPLALAAQGVSLPPALSAFLDSPLNPAAFAPSLMALLLTLRESGWKGVGALLRRGLDFRFAKSWLLVIVFMPLLIFGGGTALAAALGGTALDLSVWSNPAMALIAPLVILFTAGPLQEEFGWRGYALPRLQRSYNALVSSLILGVIWWLWHLPLVFIPGKFMVSDLPLFGLLGVEIVLTSILFTWINNNSGGSVLAALLFHTMMNWSIWVLNPSMQATGLTIGMTIGLLLLAVGVVLRIFGAQRLAADLV